MKTSARRKKRNTIIIMIYNIILYPLHLLAVKYNFIFFFKYRYFVSSTRRHKLAPAYTTDIFIDTFCELYFV